MFRFKKIFKFHKLDDEWKVLWLQISVIKCFALNIFKKIHKLDDEGKVLWLTPVSVLLNVWLIYGKKSKKNQKNPERNWQSTFVLAGSIEVRRLISDCTQRGPNDRKYGVHYFPLSDHNPFLSVPWTLWPFKSDFVTAGVAFLLAHSGLANRSSTTKSMKEETRFWIKKGREREKKREEKKKSATREVITIGAAQFLPFVSCREARYRGVQCRCLGLKTRAKSRIVPINCRGSL